MNVFGKLKVRMEAARVKDVWKTEGAFPLLVLPSTTMAFDLAQRVRLQMPVAVIGDRKLMGQWVPTLSDCVISPLALWKQVKGQDRLPMAVISFQDQLVGTDASFLTVKAHEKKYSLSIIEMMLLMRFHPPAFVGIVTARAGSRSTSLEVRRYGRRIDATLPKDEFGAVLTELMLPMIESLAHAGNEWHASRRFALKVDGNIENVAATRLHEIEALVRLGHATHAFHDADGGLLRQIKDARKAMLCVTP